MKERNVSSYSSNSSDRDSYISYSSNRCGWVYCRVSCYLRLVWRFSFLFSALLHLSCEHLLCGGRGVDTGGLDRYDEVALVFQEILSIQTHDTSLVETDTVWIQYAYNADDGEVR